MQARYDKTLIDRNCIKEYYQPISPINHYQEFNQTFNPAIPIRNYD